MTIDKKKTDEVKKINTCIHFFLLVFLASLQQAFNATAVVRHMRRLQLGTSLEGPSQITPTSPCHGHLLPEEEVEEEEDELGNAEEESCKSAACTKRTNTTSNLLAFEVVINR